MNDILCAAVRDDGSFWPIHPAASRSSKSSHWVLAFLGTLRRLNNGMLLPNCQLYWTSSCPFFDKAQQEVASSASRCSTRPGKGRKKEANVIQQVFSVSVTKAVIQLVKTHSSASSRNKTLLPLILNPLFLVQSEVLKDLFETVSTITALNRNGPASWSKTPYDLHLTTSAEHIVSVPQDPSPCLCCEHTSFQNCLSRPLLWSKHIKLHWTQHPGVAKTRSMLLGQVGQKLMDVTLNVWNNLTFLQVSSFLEILTHMRGCKPY